MGRDPPLKKPAADRPIMALAVAGVVCIHASLLAWWAWCHSPTWDEVATLPGGLRIWQEGLFDVYTVNPPLVKCVAALPVAWMSARCDWTSLDAPNDLRPEFATGRRFIEINGRAAFTWYTVARWACIPFSVLGAIVCYRYARALYGAASGILALILWCSCPNILGHGALITPDAAAASLGLAAICAFWRWLREPSWNRVLVLGVAWGLAELTKLTWLVLYLVLPLVWLIDLVAGRSRSAHACGASQDAQRAAAHRKPAWYQLTTAAVISVYIVNAGYAFEGTCIALGEYRFLSTTLGGVRERGEFGQRMYANRFHDSWCGWFPVPLPANYVLGADLQRLDFETGKPSYLRGEWRDRGWWYYYLYAMAIKIPLGTLLVLAGAVAVSLARRGYVPRPRDELIVLLPACAVLAVVSSHTSFNHHLRYVLPAFPFLFVWASKLARCWPLGHRGIQVAVILLVGWSVASSLTTFPHNLSYFNEIVGGPENGRWHLANSNTDWGQDLFFIKKWQDDHPETLDWYLDYDLPLVDPKILGIRYRLPPVDPRSASIGASFDKAVFGPRPGWYAVGVNRLHSRARDYDYLLSVEPIHWIGWTTPVYYLTLAEANRLRRELGLPELQESGLTPSP